jgi:hypothetical protein
MEELRVLKSLFGWWHGKQATFSNSNYRCLSGLC